jgi:hypothetical protein
MPFIFRDKALEVIVLLSELGWPVSHWERVSNTAPALRWGQVRGGHVFVHNVLFCPLTLNVQDLESVGT